MKTSRYWFLFAACSVVWLTVSLLIAPAMSGVDVMIFRDAGWNLASTGSFESAGLLYMHDLAPKFFSHYTPLMPLLFSGYASVFPRNAYAGTIFNLLLGILAAASALYWVLHSAYDGKLKAFAALAIAIFPVAFITYDRPEALGFVLACAAIAYAARPGSRAMPAGLLIGLVFLAHPFAALVTSVWVFAFFLLRNWENPKRWTLTLAQTGIAGAFAALVLIPVAAVYYFLDPSSLGRFAVHALGFTRLEFSGQQSSSYLQLLEKLGVLQALRTRGFPIFFCLDSIFSFVVVLMLAAWVLLNRRRFGHAEWIPLAAGFASVLAAVFLFPRQSYYMDLLAFLVPTGLLIASRWSGKLSFPGLVLLLVAIFSIFLPGYTFSLLLRFEQRSSYRAAREQPAYLLAHLPSADAIVALDGDYYDFFKQDFHHLFNTQHLGDGAVDTSATAAVANCYSAFPGGPGMVRPLQKELNPSEFHLIQPAPEHMWITLFGHKATSTQWGYGCDLYLRNEPASDGKPSHL